MPGLIRLDIVVPDEEFDRAIGLMVRHVSFGWEELNLPDGKTCFRLHTDNGPLLETLLFEIQALLPQARLETTEIENQDWTVAWKEFFTPVRAGRFVVLPPWLTDSAPEGFQPVVIDPKSAFGTGHHASTVLCLEALSRLLDTGLKPGVALDLGAGTGVLGIACATQGFTVLGTDIDPVAVANARENLEHNRVDKAMTVRLGSTEAARGERFDLILANILAAPLRELAPDIMRLLRPGGRLILSGILGAQAADVAACYQALGEPVRLEQGEWAALVW